MLIGFKILYPSVSDIAETCKYRLKTESVRMSSASATVDVSEKTWVAAFVSFE